MKRPWHIWWSVRGESELRALMMSAWDPIGVQDEPAAAGEYDSYVPEVGRLLRDRRSVDEIARYLTDVRVELIGLPADEALDRAAAQAIRDWYESPMTRRARTADT